MPAPGIDPVKMGGITVSAAENELLGYDAVRQGIAAITNTRPQARDALRPRTPWG